MSHAWEQTIHINEVIASQLIEAQQDLKIQTISLLDQGWDNVVYCVNEKFIFRFPRREFGVVCMENEIALTPYIQQQVSFPLSASTWIGMPTEQYPYAYSGYRMLSGKPLCEASHTLIDDEFFAITLATWLKELHAIPVTEAHIANVKGDYEWKLNVAQRLTRCQENLEKYAHFFAEARFKKSVLLDSIHYLKQWHFDEVKRSFVHGDLYSRHIIVNPETLLPSGLIDWGDVHIGHPGVDLSSGMIFTKKALTTFLKAYGSLDEETKRIMLFNSFCHSISFLPYAFEQNKTSLKQWAIMVLQRAVEEIESLR